MHINYLRLSCPDRILPSQATLVIRAPASLLAPHAMSLLSRALALLEAAATESQFAAELSVRLRKLHSQASQVFQSPSFRSADQRSPSSLPARIAEKLAIINPSLAMGVDRASPHSSLLQTPPEPHMSPGLMPPLFSMWSNIDPASWSAASPGARPGPSPGMQQPHLQQPMRGTSTSVPTPGTDSTQGSIPFQTPDQAWWAPSQASDPFFSK